MPVMPPLIGARSSRKRKRTLLGEFHFLEKCSLASCLRKLTPPLLLVQKKRLPP